MKLVEKKDSKVKVFGAEEKSNEFKMMANAKAFKILSDGIYGNKIRAVIRELSVNARDSHIAAGKVNVPFNVHIPTHNNPEFYVEDFGIGLSEEQIEQVYSTFFASDKESSNDYTGCLGLGSKTPFCYNTKSFVVESWFKGKHYVYSCFINNYGIPSYVKLLTEDSTREDGVKISFAVAKSDLYNFSSEALDVYSYFDLKPNILGNKIKIEEPERKLNFDYWAVVPNESYVLMGNIAYPINTSIIGLDDLLKVNNIELRLPIGTVEVDTSREGLSYTKTTIKALNDYCAKIKSEIKGKVEKDIASAKSLYQAMLLVRTFQDNLGSLINTIQFDWNGKTIPDFIDLKGIKGFVTLYERYTYDTRVRQSSQNKIYYDPIVIDDMGKGAIVRAKQFLDTVKPTRYYHRTNLVQLENIDDPVLFKQNLDEFLERAGATEEDVKFASKLPYVKPNVAKGGTGAVKLCEFMLYNMNASYAKYVWLPITGTPSGGLYIIRKGFQLLSQTGETNYFDLLKRHMRKLSAIDSTITTKEVYGVRPSDVDSLDKTKWKLVWDYLDEQTKTIKDTWYDLAQQKIVDKSHLNSLQDYFNKLFEIKNVLKNHPIVDFLDEFDKRSSETDKDYGYCEDICRYFGYNLPSNASFDLSSEWSKLVTKYPGLQWYVNQYATLPSYLLVKYVKAVDAGL